MSISIVFSQEVPTNQNFEGLTKMKKIFFSYQNKQMHNDKKWLAIKLPIGCFLLMIPSTYSRQTIYFSGKFTTVGTLMNNGNELLKSPNGGTYPK